MPQPKIPLKPKRMYHVWTHANGSDNLFRNEENYTYFLDRYSYHVHPVADTFAYCLMPNHLHLMIRVRGEKEVLEYLRVKKEDPTLQGFETLGGFSKVISQQFSNLFNGYTQAFNNKYERMGSLFKPNFERKCVDNRKYFKHLIAYIHNNPIHHGFVKDYNDWLYSSWFAYLFDKRTKIKKMEGLNWFGSEDTFRKVHQNIQFEKLISIFE